MEVQQVLRRKFYIDDVTETSSEEQAQVLEIFLNLTLKRFRLGFQKLHMQYFKHHNMSTMREMEKQTRI